MTLEDEEVEDDSYPIECPVVVTERLVLRPPHEDDIPELAQLANNRNIAEMLSTMPHPYSEDDARHFVERGLIKKRSGCKYAVALAESGVFIGNAGLDRNRDGLELGYWVGEPYWGQGYATEIAHSLVDLVFRATDIDKISAVCRITNPASRRVLHKCGFQYVGQGIRNSKVAGVVPVEEFQIDRKMWLSLRNWGAKK